MSAARGRARSHPTRASSRPGSRFGLSSTADHSAPPETANVTGSTRGAPAVTNRIRLTTSILILPYRTNTPEVAKQAASVDRLSGGRLTLGVGMGSRTDDYETSGVPTKGRGQRFDAQLEEMKRIWAG